MSVQFRWYGDAFEKRLESAIQDGLMAAAVTYQAELKRVVGRSGQRGAIRSAPGEPPRRQTGNLQRNILIDQEKGIVRVGITKNAKYGLWLELGTNKMAARPFFVPTLKALSKKLQRIFEATVKQRMR